MTPVQHLSDTDWDRLRDDLSRVITRHQPFGPPDAAQFTSSRELMRLLYDPDNRTHQQAESSGAPFVIGRKGAGKTAFVAAPKLDATAIPVELPSADLYQGVFDIVRELVYRRGVTMYPEHTALLWRHVAWCAVLADIARGKQQRTTAFRRVRELCQSLGDGTVPADAHAAVSAYLRRLKAMVEADVPVGGVGGLLNSVSGNGWTITQAIEAGEKILANAPYRYVLIVDSLEHYVGDLPTTEYQQPERVAFEGLFRFVGGDGTHPDRAFDIRFAFPAEMWSVLEKVSANPIKDFHRRVMAHWSARELIVLIGNRLHIYCHLYERAIFDEGQADTSRASQDGEPADEVRPDALHFDESRALMDRVLPAELINGYGSKEDTVAYVLRHTQLLPRHVITTLNRVWEAQAAHGSGSVIPIRPIAVIEGIRRGLDEIVGDVLAAFASVHPHARLCCERTLPNLDLVASEGELHRAYNQAGIRKATGLDFRQHLRMLIEIGCLGRVVDAKSTTRYVVGEFEYTRAGSLHLGADEMYCLHPAFAEAFECRQSTRRVRPLRLDERRAIRPVYPIGSDPDDPHDYRDALPDW